MSKNLINDGYSRPGYIAAVDRDHSGRQTEFLHGELAFEYRPMLPEEVEELTAAVDAAKPKESIRLIAAEIARRLTSWSETETVKEDGKESGKDVEKPVQITFEAVRHLPYPLIYRLRNIITGTSASDLRPKATKEEQSDYVKGLQLAMTGKAPGQAMLEADQKN